MLTLEEYLRSESGNSKIRFEVSLLPEPDNSIVFAIRILGSNGKKQYFEVTGNSVKNVS